MKKLLLLLLCVPLILFYLYNTGYFVNEDLDKKYAGECLSGDCENGQGTYSYGDGSKYVGEWKDDKRNGKGTVTYGEPQSIYTEFWSGEWKNDKRHGEGTFKTADGKVGKGLWENDKKIILE